MMQVNFSPEFGNWLLHNLERGCAVEDLVTSMIEQRFDPLVAHGLVDAFVRARRVGASAPESPVTLEGGAEYRYETPRLPPGAVLRAADRDVPVLMRTEQPVLALLSGVLSDQECDELIRLARPRLRPSTVVDPQTGVDTIAEYRDSEGMFFRLAENEFIARLDRRIAELMNLPLENGEGLQVLRYGPAAKTEPHFDFLLPSNAANRASIARSGQRASTLVIYLNDVPSGGETIFPALGLAVSAKKGNAVYFEYTNSRGEVDAKTLHAGAPVIAGEKWAVTKWMRERRFVSV